MTTIFEIKSNAKIDPLPTCKAKVSHTESEKVNSCFHKHNRVPADFRALEWGSYLVWVNMNTYNTFLLMDQ